MLYRCLLKAFRKHLVGILVKNTKSPVALWAEDALFPNSTLSEPLLDLFLHVKFKEILFCSPDAFVKLLRNYV